MKFECDKCHSHYTIADERVRGKTMKIRCKKCQHLITVGEAKRTSTSVASVAPEGVVAAAPQPSADDEQTQLQDLPASASASMSNVSARASGRVSVAPAQLDVPWFVSVDGDEVGPLTLAQARDWVAARAGQGEMFCWSEGFDEWMPVEKVSHFRHVAIAPGGGDNNPFASLPKRELRATEPPPAAEDSGDLDIGEVSRIVNLAELAKADAAKRAKAAAAPDAAPAVAANAGPRRTVMMGAAVALPTANPEQAERALEAMAESKQNHRRSSLAVLVIAGLVAVGAVTLIFALATKSTDDGGASDIEFATETDSLGRRISLPNPTGTQPTPTGGKRTPTGTTARGTTGGQASGQGTTSSGGTATTKPDKVEIGPDGQKLTALTADDVISVSSKMQSGTRRCYERAQKEDPFFKAPKIIVRVVIARSGAVSTVSLDKEGNTTFGACLVSAIKRWPFRASTEGLTIDLPLVFGQS